MPPKKKETISFGAFTKKQIAELFQNVGLGTVAADDLFLAYMLEIINAKNLMNPDIYNDMLRALRIPAGIKELDIAKFTPDNPNRQGNLVTLMLKSELNKIANVIQKGIAEGKNPLDVKRDLDMVKGLDNPRAARLLKYENYLRAKGELDEEIIQKKVDRYFNKLLNDRKETIARTEMRYATGEGHYEEAKENKKRWKAWMTVKDDRVSDLCAGNEAVSWIKIEDQFPSGHSHVPGHPNCRCTIAYKSLDPDKEDIDYMAKRIKETEEARTESVSD